MVLDINLGKGTTGFDIARYARSRFPEIGVIFSSGSPPAWLGAFGVEGALFVPKPCTDAALLDAFALVHHRNLESSEAEPMSLRTG